MTPETLPIALRVYPAPDDAAPRRGSRRVLPLPKVMLVFDTETRTDATQALTFGSYRYFVEGKCLEEGLFYADELTVAERRVLEAYVSDHAPDVDPDEGAPELRLLTRAQFLDLFYEVAYDTRALIVGFNLPFDLSRLAHDVAPARGDMVGGFSFGLWSYVPPTGAPRRHPFRPRLAIKHIDSKRALMTFKGQHQPNRVDRIPEGSTTGQPDSRFIFYGNFLDLRRLAYALTDRAYTLKDACEAFGVAHGKVEAAEHGVVTEVYIDYNRRDVLATAELAAKLLEEFGRHPIPMRATSAFSSASIGRAYLRAMGIRPILERQPDFPPRFLGYAQSAFFGGRTSAHIRNVPVPVVYTDFLSMYPTVNSLLNVWAFVVAARIDVVEYCQDKITALLQRLTLDDVFRPETWTLLTAFVRVVPDGDVLPARCQFGLARDWQVGVNHLHASSGDPSDALWFALPDVVASVLLTGRVPRIVDAFRLVPVGQQDGLQPTRLRGEIPIDPRSEDFFRKVIEERKRLGRHKDIKTVSPHLDRSLKILANAASYGIYAEMRRDDDPVEVSVRCHGIDADPFQCDVTHRDTPGECAFPPLAALTTSAARLMLATLERCVTDLGGTYAMEDTDSMAIVATKHGGAVPCPGAGSDSIRALSWQGVDAIVERFGQLNPYDRSVVPGSILKVEDDNFDPTTHTRRQLHCVAISAKRYGLFLLNEKNEPVLLRRGLNNHDDGGSEHGLGHLLNPIDPESADRGWISQVWTSIIRKTMKLPTDDLPFANRPAVGKVTISSPAVLRPFATLNDGKPYAGQLKPFNFLVGTHVRPLGHPVGVSPERFHLIAPYERNPAKWLRMDWIDQYSERIFKITTKGQHGTRTAARVKTYGEVIAEYETHPEAKCAGLDDRACTRQTVGLLDRRHVQIGTLRYIGKESNAIEEVDAGLVHTATDVYTEYPDPRRDEWTTRIVPVLKRIPLKVFERLSGKPRKMLIDADGSCVKRIVRSSRRLRDNCVCCDELHANAFLSRAAPGVRERRPRASFVAGSRAWRERSYRPSAQRWLDGRTLRMAPQSVPFSTRNRGARRHIDADFPADARTGLLHILYDLIDREYIAGWAPVARELQRIGRVSPVEYDPSSVAARRRAQTDAEEVLSGLAWDRVLDFCERLFSYLAKDVTYWDEGEYRVSTTKAEVQAFVAGELQRLFVEEGLAFEFNEGVVRRRGRKHTVEVSAQAAVVLGDPRLAAARKHYDKALQFFRNPSRPDYENVVKEAVCCVEAAGKSLFPEAKAATLGDLAKWLVSDKGVQMPKTLGQTVVGIYGYRNGGDGIGHGGSGGGAATVDVAEYVLAVCASQVIYLLALANGREDDIPF